jgi:hypothetical protein
MEAPAVAAAAGAGVDIPGGDEAPRAVDELAEPADLAGDREVLPEKEMDLVCSTGWRAQRYLGDMISGLDAMEGTLFVLSIGRMVAVVDGGCSANCLSSPTEMYPTEVRYFQPYCLAVPLAGAEEEIDIARRYLLAAAVVVVAAACGLAGQAQHRALEAAVGAFGLQTVVTVPGSVLSKTRPQVVKVALAAGCWFVVVMAATALAVYTEPVAPWRTLHEGSRESRSM